MRLSARNQIPARVTGITTGEAIANVELDANGVRLVASITVEAARDLGLAEGTEVTVRGDKSVRGDPRNQRLKPVLREFGALVTDPNAPVAMVSRPAMSAGAAEGAGGPQAAAPAVCCAAGVPAGTPECSCAARSPG